MYFPDLNTGWFPESAYCVRLVAGCVTLCHLLSALTFMFLVYFSRPLRIGFHERFVHVSTRLAKNKLLPLTVTIIVGVPAAAGSLSLNRGVVHASLPPSSSDFVSDLQVGAAQPRFPPPGVACFLLLLLPSQVIAMVSLVGSVFSFVSYFLCVF